MGYFAEIKLNEEIYKYYCKITKKILNCENTYWNIIVGTYDEKQKIVIQSFINKEKVIYFKIGDFNSNKEMSSEITFLNQNKKFELFGIPNILSSQKINEKNKFNIQVTEKFDGDKVPPYFTEDIYKIYKEISKDKFIIDGIECEFSHGDFAPWNLKYKNNKYVVFDWEHCGIRICQFDLFHFIVVVEEKLNGKTLEEAFDVALKNIEKFEPIIINKEKFFEEYKKLRL